MSLKRTLSTTTSTWDVLKTKFKESEELTINTELNSSRSRYDSSPKSGSRSSSPRNQRRRRSSSRFSSRGSSPRSPRISAAQAKKCLNQYDTDQLSVMRRFIAMAENKQFAIAFSAWRSYLIKHRIWDMKRKKLISQKNMVLICQQHPPGTRTKNHIHELSNWIQNHGPSIFKNLLKKEIIDICQNMIIKTYTANEILFLQGQKGNTFWIIVQGQVKIFVENDKSYEQVKLHNYIDKGVDWCNEAVRNDNKWLGHEVARMNGGGFGELALFEGNGLRNASALSIVGNESEPTEIICLPKNIYLRTIAYIHKEAFITKRKINFLKQLPLFETWSQRRVIDTAYSMERVQFAKGSRLVEQNTEPNALYFIVVGEVKLLRLMDNYDIIDLNKVDHDNKKKKKQRKKNASHHKKTSSSVLPGLPGLSGRVTPVRKMGTISTSNSSRNTFKKDTNNKGGGGIIETWRDQPIPKFDKKGNEIKNKKNALDITVIADATKSSSTTPTTQNSSFSNIPTPLQVVHEIKTTRIKKKIVYSSPKHTRSVKPTMELSKLGKKSILGLMSPALFKIKSSISTLSNSSRNGGSIGDHEKKQLVKLNRIRVSSVEILFVFYFYELIH
jgi:CRP-like cAMP-binding protein